MLININSPALKWDYNSYEYCYDVNTFHKQPDLPLNKKVTYIIPRILTENNFEIT